MPAGLKYTVPGSEGLAMLENEVPTALALWSARENAPACRARTPPVRSSAPVRAEAPQMREEKRGVNMFLGVG